MDYISIKQLYIHMMESLAAVHTQSLSLFHLSLYLPKYKETKHTSLHKKVLEKWFRKGERAGGRTQMDITN